MDALRSQRREFVEQAGACWVCGEARATDCHEIACGSHRAAALSERCTWLAVCTFCNCYRLTDRAEWPLLRQLAIKWICDREHFDLAAFNAIRGRAPTAIEWHEVVIAICWELDFWNRDKWNRALER